MANERIKLNDTTIDILIKMSDGNPGALSVLMQILQEGAKIDTDDIMQGLGSILILDSNNIYGSAIYVLHNDICNRDIVKTIAVLRSTQLGFFDKNILKDACEKQDYSGKDLVPVDELYSKVKKRLPNFDKKEENTEND